MTVKTKPRSNLPSPSLIEILGRMEKDLSRLKRLFATQPNDLPRALRLGQLEVDLDRHIVLLKNRPVHLAPKEFRVLHELIQANGRVLSRDYLMRTVWGEEAFANQDIRSVDQVVTRMRRAFGPEARRVVTVVNFGYRIELA
jgi:DNA-binding response OmpR family regulator